MYSLYFSIVRIKLFCEICAYVDTVRGEWGKFFGQGQRLVGRSPRGGMRGSRGRSPSDAGEIFKIFLIKPMKNYNFRPIFQNFNENFANLKKNYKISRIFRENLGKILFSGGLFSPKMPKRGCKFRFYAFFYYNCSGKGV